MGIFAKIFNRIKTKHPEDDFKVTITDTLIKVEHPKRKTEQVYWENIEEIKFINTGQGPSLPDIWLALIGNKDGCLIPQGAKGFDEVYEIVSKYEGFKFENAIRAMAYGSNGEFQLWIKK